MGAGSVVGGPLSLFSCQTKYLRRKHLAYFWARRNVLLFCGDFDFAGPLLGIWVCSFRPEIYIFCGNVPRGQVQANGHGFQGPTASPRPVLVATEPRRAFYDCLWLRVWTFFDLYFAVTIVAAWVVCCEFSRLFELDLLVDILSRTLPLV